MRRNTVLLLLLLWFSVLSAQQIPDTSYRPQITSAQYMPGEGPVVFVDAGHNNFHTKDDRYFAFAKLLERDGYVLKSYDGNFTRKKLDKGKILVISNALNAVNVNDWFLPTPSAFTAEEVETVRQWVSDGGSVFLIADHMPMAGAAEDLAAAFGFTCTNGFVLDTLQRGPAEFDLKDNSLIDGPVTRGSSVSEHVDHIATFTGQGFDIPEGAIPILVFDEKYVNLLPDTAWVFDASTRISSAEGLKQLAYTRYGKGRVVLSGEAAMFTAQLAGPDYVKAGMNTEVAKQNYQLLLNLIHWLDGKLE